MNRLMTVFMISLTGTMVFAQSTEGVSFKATEIANGLHMLEGAGGFTGGNVGLIAGDDGVVIIDDSFPPFMDLLKGAIAKVTDKPIDFVVNTHVHADHLGGNETMGKAGATIIAHNNIRKRLVEDGIQSPSGTVKAPKEALPVITFSDAVTFHHNGLEARVMHMKNAHTDGDAIIHFPGVDVIHTGDIMFNGMYPFIDLDSGGSVDGYIAAQEKILSLCTDKTKIIPGHGPLASKGDLEKAVNMLKDTKKKVAALIAKGMSEEEIVKANPLAEYHDDWNWVFITTERMTKTLYKSLKE